MRTWAALGVLFIAALALAWFWDGLQYEKTVNEDPGVIMRGNGVRMYGLQD